MKIDQLINITMGISMILNGLLRNQSNTDIAFILNYNYLYLEKFDLIENDKKDFSFSNQILFDGAQSFFCYSK